MEKKSVTRSRSARAAQSQYITAKMDRTVLMVKMVLTVMMD